MKENNEEYIKFYKMLERYKNELEVKTSDLVFVIRPKELKTLDRKIVDILTITKMLVMVDKNGPIGSWYLLPREEYKKYE